MNEAPLAILAAGGTGGHIFPAQALSEELLSRGWRVKLSTDARGARFVDQFAKDVEIEIVSAAHFSRRAPLTYVKSPLKIAAGILSLLASMRRDPPQMTVGFGGYPSFPAMMAAGILRHPRLLHEQNGVLGKVNAYLSRSVPHIACGTWPTALPSHAIAHHIGNPLRAAVHDFCDQDYAPPKRDHPVTLLVIGGSQGASLLSRVLPSAVAGLDAEMRARLHMLHQARPEDHASVEAAYRASGVKADIRPFFDDLPARMAGAQLVISRAGASSLAEIAAIGRPSILIPLAAARRDEQTANARALVEAGGAFMLREEEFTDTRLRELIDLILSEPQRAKGMAEAARKQAKPQATKSLADLVENLAKDLS